MISDFNASKEDSRTDRYPRRADDQEYSYQDTFNDTDDYSNKDDVSYQTDEESDQREKPTVQAVYTNSVSQDLNYCVASRSISNSTTSTPGWESRRASRPARTRPTSLRSRMRGVRLLSQDCDFASLCMTNTLYVNSKGHFRRIDQQPHPRGARPRSSCEGCTQLWPSRPPYSWCGSQRCPIARIN